MPLIDVEIPEDDAPLPEEVARFLEDADVRVNEFYQGHRVPQVGFVPSDFITVFRALRAITQANLAAGDSFCEWGSGLGVVASLAAMLEFDACGIEIESSLVDAARELAEDYDVSAEFVHGSFIPPGGEAYAEETYAASNNDISWLVTDADNAYDELGLDADGFDLIYAFPWPGDESVVEGLFEHYAAHGALLLTQHSNYALRLRRNVPPPPDADLWA